MKSRPRFLQILLCLLGASGLLHAVQLPTTVQFDLVFPRNNTVYKPVYPFPVVFGLHNGSAAWPYIIWWEWDITSSGTGDLVAYGGYTPGIYGEEKPAAPPDTHLIIDPVSQIFNTTAQKLLLRYTFGIRNACNETTGEVPSKHELDVLFNQGFSFSLDRENGQVPDITASGSCAIPVGSVGIQKDIPTRDDGLCPILAPGPQPTQECALPINEAVATRVAAGMLAHAGCPDQTWPNVTGLTGKCRPKTSGQNQLWYDGIMFTSTMAVLGLTILLL
jgi:hypothetical protein